MGFFKQFIKSLRNNMESQADGTRFTKSNHYPDPWSPEFKNTTIGKMQAQHYRNLEKIESFYSILYNAKAFHGNKADQLIALCKKDIDLAPTLKDFWLSTENILPEYGTFKRLAILYERRKEYDEAISVCIQSLELGFEEDNKPGKTQARVARLLRLAGRTDELKNYLDN